MFINLARLYLAIIQQGMFPTNAKATLPANIEGEFHTTNKGIAPINAR
jgi:hypothetical protein